MRVRHLKLGLVATCMLTLWLMASFLDQESSQNDLHEKASTRSRICHCPRNSSRKCICSSRIHECSACLHIPGESDWFDERFERAIEPLQRSEEPMSSDALMLWLGIKSEKEFENQKQQPIKVSPKHPLGYVGSSCRTCAVVGNSRFLRGSGLGFRINQHDMVLRMNQAPVQGFEMDVGNTTTMRIMYPEIASTQDPGTQLLLLPLNSSGLKWFMKILQEQDIIWKPRNPGSGDFG
ncbi:PREDICTED: CMP-N-acetylneuraminate-beta-galactosamide-alpha-2,3-sialyltransferase 2-like [Ceratotherium simum simum]|uniref:beta-D-galactosyl-(1->3)-N-acetyl-beta-D-galactosaminide alpha-2,3-sialyltransferase n=1 Tax=Ceratotherium simum simum TaxID=73337 RepID=A0ABM1CU28_CERSS|nr:PREDICTED: CMP-N-acetylneuraminate-beta-galactosamide-alpha-2,3-sialyltransferase 2-like [Ceratotherium simum simum]